MMKPLLIAVIVTAMLVAVFVVARRKTDTFKVLAPPGGEIAAPATFTGFGLAQTIASTCFVEDKDSPLGDGTNCNLSCLAPGANTSTYGWTITFSSAVSAAGMNIAGNATVDGIPAGAQPMTLAFYNGATLLHTETFTPSSSTDFSTFRGFSRGLA
jgi:hypothetical protein